MSYTFPNTLASTKPKFFMQGEADEVCPLEGDVGVLRAGSRSRRSSSSSTRADHLFDGQTPEVGEALEDLLGDFEGARHEDAVIVSRRADRRSARRRTARCAPRGRTRWRRS